MLHYDTQQFFFSTKFPFYLALLVHLFIFHLDFIFYFFFDNLAAHSIQRNTIRTKSKKKKTKKKELKEKSTHKIAAYTISSAPNRRQTEVKSNGSNIIFIRNRTLSQHPMTITSSKKLKKTIEGSIFFDCYDCCHFSLFSLLCKIYKYAHLLVHL